MAYETHESSLSFVELYKLIFKKKNCPTCGEKRMRTKKRIDKGKGWHSESDSDGTSFEYGQKYDYKYYYRCENCDSDTELRYI